MIRVDLTPREASRVIGLVEGRIRQYPSLEHLPREEFVLVDALRKLVVADHQFRSNSNQEDSANVANETASPEST